MIETNARAVDPVDAPRERRHWTRDPLEIAWRVAAGILLLLFLIWLVLFITKGRFLKPYFESYASRQAERQVRVAGDFQLFFNPINIKFLAEGLSISNPEWARGNTLFSARLIDMNVATFSFLFGDERINWINLRDARANLEWDRQGKRNTWTFSESEGEPLDLPAIRRAAITGSRVRYRDPPMLLDVDVGFQTVRARETSVDDRIGFSGGGTLRAKPFTLSGSLNSVNETVRGGRNRLAMRAESTGHRLDLTGTLPSAFQLEGAPLRIDVRGPNLARLFDFLGVAIPDTRQYRLTSALMRRDEAWRFTGMDGRFGASDVAGAMTITMPNDRLRIDADVRSRVLDIIDAGPFIGYDPYAVAERGTVVQNEGGRPRMLPDAPLRIEAISRFDAHVNYRAARIRMENNPISNLALTLDLDNRLMKLSPLTFDIARGHFASDISIDARQQPVRTDIDARLSPTPMGILLARFGAEQSGTTGTIKARVQLNGRGDTVREMLGTSNGRIAFIMPKGTFWTRNVQLAEIDIGTFVQKMFEKKLERPVQINCGLIAFTVRGGLAAADPILIDTTRNVITGRGGFSFRNESLDLGVEADAKTFSLFSGQSPVGVSGYFAQPSINPISGELLARAGIGLGLAVVASPVAGILAFVDVGDAEDTSCGPVLAGARATGQREEDGDKVEKAGSGKDAVKGEKRKKFLGIF
jgi:AsmA family protein